MADSARVAGWQDSAGGWQNVEAGDREPSDADLARSERIVVAVDDVDGETHYLTTSHLTPDFDLDDFLDDIETSGDGDRYGGEFV